MRLRNLQQGQRARVVAVDDAHPGDTIARRLRELGFIPGAPLRLLALAPFGGDPMLIGIGGSRFALRRAEAERVRVEADA